MIDRDPADHPLVTVVMAAYNAEQHIAQAIQSVQAQSFSNWELICVDDGSTDATRSLIAAFGSSDRRIKLLTQANLGPAEARRAAYRAGAGAYFLLLDADDWFAPDTLSTLMAEAQATDADGVVCRVMHHDAVEDGWVCFLTRRGTPIGAQYSGREAFALTFPWRIVGNCLWRKHVIEAEDANTQTLNAYNADEYVTRRLFLHCRKVVIGSGAYFYSSNPDSLTRKRSWKSFLRLETDRRLTELAISEGVEPAVLSSVLKWQRDGFAREWRHLVRYGAFQRRPFVLREFRLSALHIFQHNRDSHPVALGAILLLRIGWNIVVGGMQRFGFSRS